MPTISRLSTAPVKGLALATVPRVHLEPDGVRGDRRFVLVDASDRRIASHRYPVLHSVRPTYRPGAGHLELRFPDGRTVADRVRGGAPVETRVHRGPVSGFEVEGPFADALSQLAGATVRLVHVTSPGGANDEDPVSMLSDATVSRLARESEDGPIDPRRFRMLVGLSDCRPHEEDGWRGRNVRLGTAVVHVEAPIPRCAVTTVDPDAGARNLDTLAAIRRHRERAGGGVLDLGMYATVVEPGLLAVGDPVVPL